MEHFISTEEIETCLKPALSEWHVLAQSTGKTLWVGIGREKFKVCRGEKTEEVDDLYTAVNLYNYGWK